MIGRPEFESKYTEPWWDDPRWRAQMVANLTARGISARRADEIVAGMAKRYAAEDAKDRAYDRR